MSTALQTRRETLRRNIGERLYQGRLAADLSQKDVAARIGITQASVSNYECAKREIPLLTFVRWARVLGLNCGEVLHEAVREEMAA